MQWTRGSVHAETTPGNGKTSNWRPIGGGTGSGYLYAMGADGRGGQGRPGAKTAAGLWPGRRLAHAPGRTARLPSSPCHNTVTRQRQSPAGARRRDASGQHVFSSSGSAAWPCCQVCPRCEFLFFANSWHRPCLLRWPLRRWARGPVCGRRGVQKPLLAGCRCGHACKCRWRATGIHAGARRCR